uniref:Nodule cysteine-rich protein 3 n=1 Tax=Cicer arietinum TaxID=3827 RepID=A0A0U8TE87_CICAR|nr:TPA_exp: nodule cysteine-rich protein 3 [Cicer arietinum]
MAELLKFVYAIILFLSIFLVVADVGAMCEEDNDCPVFWCFPDQTLRCITKNCYCLY